MSGRSRAKAGAAAQHAEGPRASYWDTNTRLPAASTSTQGAHEPPSSSAAASAAGGEAMSTARSTRPASVAWGRAAGCDRAWRQQHLQAPSVLTRVRLQQQQAAAERGDDDGTDRSQPPCCHHRRSQRLAGACQGDGIPHRQVLQHGGQRLLQQLVRLAAHDCSQKGVQGLQSTGGGAGGGDGRAWCAGGIAGSGRRLSDDPRLLDGEACSESGRGRSASRFSAANSELRWRNVWLRHSPCASEEARDTAQASPR